MTIIILPNLSMSSRTLLNTARIAISDPNKAAGDTLKVCGAPVHAIRIEAANGLEIIQSAGTPIVTASGFDAGNDGNPTFFKVLPGGKGLETVGCDKFQLVPRAGQLDMRGTKALSEAEDRDNWAPPVRNIAGIIDFTGEKVRLLVGDEVIAEYSPKKI